MCPTCIVLTDSPYDSATDTLTEKRVQKYEKSRKGCSLLNEKNPQSKPTYLCRFFRNATGQSMMEFRRKQR